MGHKTESPVSTTNSNSPHSTTTTTMTMLYRRLLITIALTASLATAFHATPPQAGTEAVTVIPASDERSCCCCTRRSILQQALTLSTSAISITAASTANPAYADVIRSPGKCANGEGEGCDSLADNNELIRSLQKKSAENRESNQRVGALILMLS
jgi:hypothetical protein